MRTIKEKQEMKDLGKLQNLAFTAWAEVTKANARIAKAHAAAVDAKVTAEAATKAADAAWDAWVAKELK